MSPISGRSSSLSSSMPECGYTLRPLKGLPNENPLHCLQCNLAGLSCSLTSRYNIAPRGGPYSRCIRKSEPFCMREDLFGDCTYLSMDSRFVGTEAFRIRREELLTTREDRLDKENWILPMWDRKAAWRVTMGVMTTEDTLRNSTSTVT
jgi:hypothetical protein